MSAAAEILPYPELAIRSLVPVVRSVVPVVRRALLVAHTPPLSEAQTLAAYAKITEIWDRWKKEYRNVVAAKAGIDPSRLDFAKGETAVRYRFDGDTPMLDFPRLRTSHVDREPFDQRNCCALCTKEYSSKIWTRVGLPLGHVGYQPDKVREATIRFRKHAQACTEWFHDRFFALMREVFKGIRHEPAGILDVTTLALKVEEGQWTDDDYERWLLGENDKPNLRQRELRELVAAAANVSFDLRELKRHEPESYWVSMPHGMELPDGTLDSRRFLYLVRRIDNGMQAVGLGFDDSASGKLANNISLKVARFIANSI